jgi:four helix bundle protein
MKIKSFTDLTTWKEGHKLVIAIYQQTMLFPREELYSLVDQMRRCAVSITSNIAEGFSRQSEKEKIYFYCISRGSISELQNQLLIARDIGYLKREDFDTMAEQTIIVQKLLNGLIRSIKNKS